MLPPSKKRKFAETSPGASIAPAQGIRAYGKITKPGWNPQELGKNNRDGKKCAKSIPSSSIDVLGNHKKRKLQDPEESPLKQAPDRESHASVQSYQGDQHPISKHLLRSSSPPLASPVQQATPRRKCTLRSSLPETPTKGARACVESIALSSSPVSDSSLSLISKTSRTVPSSPVFIDDLHPGPEPAQDETQNLPDELQDLIQLHSSFLRALSLHYAHHGSLTPADLRLLKPSIERCWKKKRVSIDDVRRILHIAQSLEAIDSLGKKVERGGILSLSDYGKGKICVEIEEHFRPQGFQRSPLDDEALKTVFAANLDVQWKRYLATNFTSPSAPTFISLLPLHPITPCPSISKIIPLLSKGQKRLEDLKGGAIRIQPSSPLRSTSITPIAPTSASSVTPNTRNDSLLSRIRAKQLFRSTLPPPPSAATILRKSALRRIEEIAPVIELLSSSASRSTPSRSSNASHSAGQTRERGTYSLTMPTLVQYLQMSLQNPIAKQDAVRCVRLLAAEVAPGWVKVKEVGKVVGVTVWKGESIAREELARRVQDLLSKT
ncbi:hypothetical protein MMC07_009466 [Pseudocyphellaria aurata]|nr:hypothetical protein [Pseudocyphellaria aurata]